MPTHAPGTSSLAQQPLPPPPLSLQLANLAQPYNGIDGVYVLPAPPSPPPPPTTNEQRGGSSSVAPRNLPVPHTTTPRLHAVIFVHQGPYAGGVFRFTIDSLAALDGAARLPLDPNARVAAASPSSPPLPRITFDQPIPHPLIHPNTNVMRCSKALLARSGVFSQQQAAVAKPRAGNAATTPSRGAPSSAGTVAATASAAAAAAPLTLRSLLGFVKAQFKRDALERVSQGEASNLELWRILHANAQLFHKLASHAVEASLASGLLYPHHHRLLNDVRRRRQERQGRQGRHGAEEEEQETDDDDDDELDELGAGIVFRPLRDEEYLRIRRDVLGEQDAERIGDDDDDDDDEVGGGEDGARRSRARDGGDDVGGAAAEAARRAAVLGGAPTTPRGAESTMTTRASPTTPTVAPG